tara:strand:+ start:1243 stop:1794 length:552 start_codon:yes stop_codon:yes gene_type:complete
MGLVLNIDLETNLGPTTEAYISIDSIRVNKTLAEIKFSLSAWLDKSYADKFFRKYIEEDLNNAKGQISSNVLYYESENSDGEEITIPNYFANVKLARKQEVEIPVIKEVEKEKIIPQVSFDENGDEITIEKIVLETVEEQVGTEKVERSVIAYDSINAIEDFCYIYLKEELSKLFPKDKLIIE